LAGIRKDVKGYNLYRAQSIFTAIGEAVKVNANLVTVTSFDDLSSHDGDYHYRVSTVSMSENESPLSEEVLSKSDSTGPRVKVKRWFQNDLLIFSYLRHLIRNA